MRGKGLRVEVGRGDWWCDEKQQRLTSRLHLVPHLFDLPCLDLGCGRVEASYFVVLFVGEDGVWEGLVLGLGHLIFGD